MDVGRRHDDGVLVHRRSSGRRGQGRQAGGKGGGPKVTTTEYIYSASFAVGLTEGPITGIGRIAISPIFLCVNPRIGVRTIAELVAKAKEAPPEETSKKEAEKRCEWMEENGSTVEADV